MKIWILRIFGFLIGGVGGSFLVALISLLTNRFSLAMVIIPIMSAVAGSHWIIFLCHSPDSIGGRLITKYWDSSSLIRALVIAPIFWMVCVAAFIWIFEPYGYMSSSDYHHMYKIMFFPPLFLGAGSMIYFKLVKPKTTVSNKNT